MARSYLGIGLTALSGVARSSTDEPATDYGLHDYTKGHSLFSSLFLYSFFPRKCDALKCLISQPSGLGYGELETNTKQETIKESGLCFKIE